MIGIKPVHSNIKVGTIVNIMNVYNDYKKQIEFNKQKYQYYKTIGDKSEMLFTEIEIKKTREKLNQFLDYYI